MLTRRTLLKTGSLSLAGAIVPRLTLAMGRSPNVDYTLIAEETAVELLPGKITPAFTFNGSFPAPVIRARQGVPLRVEFINRLSQQSTIHWHGIRIANHMDGVPYLTQPPVEPGDSFIYEFTCPDAGTFWYHPHMHSIEQLGKGLVGALIVEEADSPPFDHETIIGLKDWRLKDDGSFLRLSNPRQAFRAGTLGTVATVNGELKPIIEVPAGQLCRLRVLNMDNTREFNIGLKNQEAQVIAIDGSPVASPYPLTSHGLGVGMRLDLGLLTPETVGLEIPVYDIKAPFYQEICRLRTVAAPATHKTHIPALPANPVPKPDLQSAETRRFVFEWVGALSPVNSEGHTDREFWTINRRAWEGMSADSLPAPLAKLEMGKSYIFELHNATPHSHPIHLHGLIFTVLASDKRDVTPYETDTILMEKNERAKVAFVADNPGDWMFHCHVIEHMKTGLMGYIRIR